MQNVIREQRIKVDDLSRVTPTTLRYIAKGIRDCSCYLPIRNKAAGAAACAPRKNYLAQMKSVFDDFVKNWRYVFDIHGLETVTIGPKAVYNIVMGNNGGANGNGLGVGDCDCCTVAIGALAKSIGFPVRIATTAPPGMPGINFTHVFAQVNIPGHGWVTVDPVLLPKAGFGAITPHSRLAIWDLKGRLIATRGVPASALKKAFKMQRSDDVPRIRPPRVTILRNRARRATT